MDMAVFRVHKNANYTVLSNYHFKEREMSLKAKGLLSLMLSLPENWDYSAAGLVTLSKDGKDSVNAALKELEKFGYLRRTQAFVNGKFSGYNYEIFEQPSDAAKAEAEEKAAKRTFAENPSTGATFAENPSTEKPSTENPPQLNNTELLNTNLSITKELNTKEEVEERKKEKAGSSYDAIINDRIFSEEVKIMLYEFIKMRKFIKKPLTDFALTELINKLESISKDEKTQIEVLKYSILNTYADIYPPKAEKEQPPARNVATVEAIGETEPDDVLTPFCGNLMLSENQIASLLDIMGLEAFDYYVDRLSEYIKENGDIKGHYATILRWYKQDSAVAVTV